MNILNEYKKFEENNETLITIYFCKKKKGRYFINFE